MCGVLNGKFFFFMVILFMTPGSDVCARRNMYDPVDRVIINLKPALALLQVPQTSAFFLLLCPV